MRNQCTVSVSHIYTACWRFDAILDWPVVEWAGAASAAGKRDCESSDKLGQAMHGAASHLK